MSERLTEEPKVPNLRKDTLIFMATYGNALPYRETIDVVQGDMADLWFGLQSELQSEEFHGDPEGLVAARGLVTGYKLLAKEINSATKAAEAYVQTSDFTDFWKRTRGQWGDVPLETLSGLFYLEGARIGLGVTVVDGLARQQLVVYSSPAGTRTVYLPGDGPL